MLSILLYFLSYIYNIQFGSNIIYNEVALK